MSLKKEIEVATIAYLVQSSFVGEYVKHLETCSGFHIFLSIVSFLYRNDA
jgi:hypothetical protein